MYLKDELNAGSLLATVAGSIQNFNQSVDVYINYIGEYELFNPFQSDFQTDVAGINKPIPSRFWERLGIRHLILDTFFSRLVAPDDWQAEQDKSDSWSSIKNDTVVEELKTLFSCSSIVQFADWAGVDGASDYWEGIFYDVLKPLERRDFQFVFRLGDISKRSVFEVDEILDIIGGYSSLGRVTLVLDHNEADVLWSKLNGIAYDIAVAGSRLQEARERQLYIFNTMNIDSLIVLYANRTVLFSWEQQSQFGGRAFENLYMPGHGRDCFDAGYRMGLLLQLNTSHCIALGQAVSGAFSRHESWPCSEVLLAYIKDWMEETSPDSYSTSLIK
ncbi:hypothetical protein [Chitinophaga filiformis]|uniref:Uncharacterized protein n=1 Tax=Chitinophaga filiformis TaxID=104663 RepID=A0A1G7H429_CHIFI|nr:hypothetical protein [Chitinophaga filiformis]SDE95172.1 hypothetical protein SAMN04488121_101298 [Chitinophaga filiformis]